MDLAVQTREKLGKATKALRRAGFIPAELYGHGVGNLHLSVPSRDFGKVFGAAGTNTVINLLIDKGKRPAIIYEAARDYLTGEVVHVDFLEVRMDEKIKAKVPLEFLGEAPAVKEKSGVLNKSMTEIEVEALPQDLPRRLSADLAALDDLNKSLYVRDLRVPAGVKVLVGEETVLATITLPVKEEVVETPVDVSAVKVETEEKKAERARLTEAASEKGGDVKTAPAETVKGEAKPSKAEAKPRAEAGRPGSERTSPGGAGKK